MAKTIHEWETNKNAVIFWFAPGCDKPYGCVVQYFGYRLSFSNYSKYFRVSLSGTNLFKNFNTLLEAKRYIIGQVNKKRNLFNEL